MNASTPRIGASRTQLVWAALVAAMTVVGGSLWALEGGRSRAFDGFALSPMIGVSRTTSIDAIFSTRREVSSDRWGAIVIDDSGRTRGSPADLEGAAGFHFVIGNGRGSGDGELFVARRWLDQEDALGEGSIRVCLIGDGSQRTFSDAQMRRLTQLVAALAERLNLSERQVVLESEAGGPGRFFREAEFREQVARLR